MHDDTIYIAKDLKDLHRYNLRTKELTQIYKIDEDAYSVRTDSCEKYAFIITVNDNLLRINVETKEMMRLTDGLDDIKFIYSMVVAKSSGYRSELLVFSTGSKGL